MKEITEGSKEKGYMMMKIFRKIMEDTERKWFNTIEGIIAYTIKLKHDNEYLLAKFFTQPEDVKTVMDNNTLTMENLANHKRMLHLTLGAYYTQESERLSAETQAKLIEEEFRKWVYGWDLLRKNDQIIVLIIILMIKIGNGGKSRYQNDKG